MFCDCVPCECNTKRVTERKPKCNKEVQVVTELPVPPTASVSTYVRPETPIEELLFNEAIRALAPLLREEDRQEYRVILASQPSSAERKRVWIARQEENDASRT